ncbi:MAG TPA: thiamine pyrophosphate-dependent enzyme [Pirellulaceae bacterium]|nr:thiamine pyrophosphate-dependent enzyme [Pirellulaceae bacterium]
MATASATLDKRTLLALYRTMQVIRQCEDRLAKSHQRGLVHGACHTYVGEEAIATGVFAHLRQEDAVFSTHRGHGHALAKGLHPKELIAELYGREAGCSQGRGGSMHLFKPEIGMMGTSGIVGPCILHACGGGYAFKIKKTDNVAVTCFGDGAVNNGAFHEGLNMASIWKLPVIFVVENNQFATEVPFSYSSGIPDVGRRAENYGIPGFEPRVCRFGIKLVEFLATEGGCKIIYTMDTTSDDNETLTDEILSILTHYTAKASGQKNKSINETKMDESQLRDAYRWYKSGGFSYRAIANRLAKEGRGKDVKGRTITRNVVMRRLQENWATLERLYADEEIEKNSFELFVEKFVRKSTTDKTRLGRKQLITAYEEWCRRENQPELSSRKISTVTARLNWQKKFGARGNVVFMGLTLTTR